MKKKRTQTRKIQNLKKGLLSVCMAVVMLTLGGCSPARTVLGVGELYGDTAIGLIMVLLDSGELEEIDGIDPSNQIYIGHQEKPDEIPDLPDDEDTDADPADTDDTNDADDDADDGTDEDNADDTTGDGDEALDDTSSPARAAEPDYYVYDTLTDDAKECYDEMLDCIENYEDSVVVYGADKETVMQINEAILADHGDLFWYEGACTLSVFEKDDEPVTSFSPQYIITEAEKEKYAQQIDSVEKEWLSGISSGASDYEKVKYVYEQLVERVTYDLEAENNQNIMSTFLTERTVCAGFSHAAQTMLQDLGVSCTYLTGTGNEGAHAWNMVCIDDVYYYMDVTWGNPSCLNEAGTGEPDYVDYSYLNVTYEEISKDHTCENDFPLPETNATEANYFAMEELYFTTDDFSEVAEAVAAASDAGENIQIKFSTDELFAEALNELIVQQQIYAYCPELSGYTYSFREMTKTLYFFFDTSVL